MMRRFFPSTIRQGGGGGINYSDFFFAFSVRKLNGYTGANCMRVIRTSDNTTLDIGFDSNGLLDLTAISTFCGASEGFVDIWYNQGSSIDMPKVSNGVRIYDGTNFNLYLGKPWLDNSGNWGYLRNTGYLFASADQFFDRKHFESCVFRSQALNSIGYLASSDLITGQTQRTSLLSRTSGTDLYWSILDGVTNIVSRNPNNLAQSTPYIHSISKDDFDDIRAYRNGTLVDTKNDPRRFASADWDFGLFHQTLANLRHIGGMFEYIADPNFTTELLDEIILEQNTFYGIY